MSSAGASTDTSGGINWGQTAQMTATGAGAGAAFGGIGAPVGAGLGFLAGATGALNQSVNDPYAAMKQSNINQLQSNANNPAASAVMQNYSSLQNAGINGQQRAIANTRGMTPAQAAMMGNNDLSSTRGMASSQYQSALLGEKQQAQQQLYNALNGASGQAMGMQQQNISNNNQLMAGIGAAASIAGKSMNQDGAVNGSGSGSSPQYLNNYDGTNANNPSASVNPFGMGTLSTSYDPLSGGLQQSTMNTNPFNQNQLANPYTSNINNPYGGFIYQTNVNQGNG